MSEIKCPRCNATGYAPHSAGSIPQICSDCGGSGTQAGPCEDCARLTREWLRQYELLVRTNQHAHQQLADTLTKLTRERDYSQDCNEALMRSLDAARAHFRRACDLLAKISNAAVYRGCVVESKSADVWQAEIVEELRLLEGKP